MKKLFKNKIFKQSAVFLLALSLMLGGLFIFNNPALANGEPSTYSDI